MTIKKVTSVVITAILVTSCNDIQKKELVDHVKTEKTIDLVDYNWIYGKTFTQEGIASENPELGGLDFLKFESKEVIEMKTGDIVEPVKATFEGDKIILQDVIQTKRVFTILSNDCLMDETGAKWSTSKQK